MRRKQVSVAVSHRFTAMEPSCPCSAGLTGRCRTVKVAQWHPYLLGGVQRVWFFHIYYLIPSSQQPCEVGIEGQGPCLLITDGNQAQEGNSGSGSASRSSWSIEDLWVVESVSGEGQVGQEAGQTARLLRGQHLLWFHSPVCSRVSGP